MHKKIVVTGAAGMIGSNMARGLNEAGYTDIIIVDHFGDEAKRPNLNGIKYEKYYDRVEFLELVKKNKIGKLDVIIHLGACTNTLETDEEFIMYNNVTYSKILFDWCEQNDCQFIYASSAATYGDGNLGFDDSTTELEQMNLYGKSKHLFDLEVLASDKKPKQWVGLKFFNGYGHPEYHKGFMASMVRQAFLFLMEHDYIELFKSYDPLYGDGEYERDFVYVKDIVKIILFFIDHPGKSGIFNVGAGKTRPFLDMVKAIYKTLDRSMDLRFIDMPEKLQRQFQYCTIADISKLRAIGYDEKFYELEEGVEDYIKNYLVPEYNDRQT